MGKIRLTLIGVYFMGSGRASGQNGMARDALSLHSINPFRGYNIDTFHINGGGDWSVDIAEIDATVIIDNNFHECQSETLIQTWKEFLWEYYDVSGKCTLTDAERRILHEPLYNE